jgi:hypothetical protein
MITLEQRETNDICRMITITRNFLQQMGPLKFDHSKTLITFTVISKAAFTVVT